MHRLFLPVWLVPWKGLLIVWGFCHLRCDGLEAICLWCVLVVWPVAGVGFCPFLLLYSGGFLDIVRR